MSQIEIQLFHRFGLGMRNHRRKPWWIAQSGIDPKWKEQRDGDKNSPRPMAIFGNQGGNKERWPPPMFSRFLFRYFILKKNVYIHTKNNVISFVLLIWGFVGLVPLCSNDVSMAIIFLKGGFYREVFFATWATFFVHPWPASKHARKRIIAMYPVTLHRTEIKSERNQTGEPSKLSFGKSRKGTLKWKDAKNKKENNTHPNRTNRSTLSSFPSPKTGGSIEQGGWLPGRDVSWKDTPIVTKAEKE